MTDQLSRAEAEQRLSPEVLQRLETGAPERRVGSALIYSSPSVSSPGRWKLAHTPTHADLETYHWVALTNQIFWSKCSHIFCPSAFCTSSCPLSLWNPMWTHTAAVPKPTAAPSSVANCPALCPPPQRDVEEHWFLHSWIIGTNDKTTLGCGLCHLPNCKLRANPVK